MSIFTDRLENLIKENRVSKLTLLSELELNKNAINTWSKRDTIPKIATLEKLAEYFDVSVDYLLGNTNLPKEVITTSDLTEEERNFLEVYFKAKESNREDVKDMLKIIDRMLDKEE